MKTRKSLLLFTSLLALLLAVCCSFSAVAEEADVSVLDLGEIEEDEVSIEAPLVSIPLPIDYSGGSAPLESGYDGDNAYRDPTIQVTVTDKDISDYLHGYRGRDAHAWIVDIRIGDASQLRTAAAESFETETVRHVDVIADRLNAVVAFNGDYVNRQDRGYVFREGIFYKDRLQGKQDVLLIDEDGDFHPVHLPRKGELSDTVDGKKVINAFCFGPILVEDGEIVPKFTNFGFLKPEKNYARLALCQVGPLHYKVILTTTEQSYTLGLQLKEFQQLCKDEGAVIAYNLDGGDSTTLYFHGQRINNQHKVNYREVPDIFYFASSWDGSNAE